MATLVSRDMAAARSRPEQGSVKALAVVFLATFVVCLLVTPTDVSPTDEGLILTGAMRVAAGEVPHRDFYALYGPGQYYVVAALFDLFGQNAWVERFYDLVLKGGIACFVYLIACRVMRPLYVYLTIVLCVLWIVEAQSPGYPIWPCLFLILASVWLTIPLFHGAYRATSLAAAGLCAGATVLFRYDMGLLSLGVLSAWLVAAAWLGPDRQSAGGVMGRMLRNLAPFWIASALILIPLVAAYVKFGIVNDFIFQTITYPSAHYVEMRALPFPPLTLGGLLNIDFIAYLPPLVVLSFVAAMTARIFSRNTAKIDIPEILTASLVAAFAFGLFFKGVVRVSVIHMAASVVPSLIVLGYLADQLRTRVDSFVRGAVAIPAVVAMVVACVSSAIAVRHVVKKAEPNFTQAEIALRSYFSHMPASERRDLLSDVSRAPGLRLVPGRYLAVHYVVDHTSPDQQILVANGVNDKTYANDNGLYFLSGRQPATKWNEFDPGLQNSEPIQSEMIRELEKNKPALVVLDSEFDNHNEPNGSSRHSGVTLLDDYIHRHYGEVKKFSEYTILQRRPAQDDL